MLTHTVLHPSTEANPAGNRLFPVVRELPADLETPVLIYLKLAGRGPSFLLESVTVGEQVARYSFIGVDRGRAFVFHREAVDFYQNGQIARRIPTRQRNPFVPWSCAASKLASRSEQGLWPTLTRSASTRRPSTRRAPWPSPSR